jgi:hypothetical protein
MKSYYLYETPEALTALGAQNVFTDIGSFSGLVSADLSDDQCKTLIPSGNYCYDGSSVCPFLDVIHHFPKQDNGYCHYLKRGDFQHTGLGLLWDSCKECGVNEYRSDYDEQ